MDTILIGEYILCPLSGALGIFFFFLAKSGKDHLVTYVLYFINNVLLLYYNNDQYARDFFILSLAFCAVFVLITLVKILKRDISCSQFPSE